MDLQLADKVVWITGASGDIGRVTAELFAAEGARVALHAYRNSDELTQWVSDQPWCDRALVLQADLADGSALEANARQIREYWQRIDVCVANAGIWPPADEPLWTLPPERLRQTIEVNLVGSLHTARAFLASLQETGPRADEDGAVLLFTGSTAGQFGERGHVDYAVSKAGLVGAVKSLKNEICLLDPYGRVNMVQPGWTVTHMAKPALEVPGAIERVTQTMALRQLGRARDIGAAFLMLASPAVSRHTSGEVLTVAGGMEGRRLWGEEEVDAARVRARLKS